MRAFIYLRSDAGVVGPFTYKKLRNDERLHHPSWAYWVPGMKWWSSANGLTAEPVWDPEAAQSPPEHRGDYPPSPKLTKSPVDAKKVLREFLALDASVRPCERRALATLKVAYGGVTIATYRHVLKALRKTIVEE